MAKTWNQCEHQHHKITCKSCKSLRLHLIVLKLSPSLAGKKQAACCKIICCINFKLQSFHLQFIPTLICICIHKCACTVVDDLNELQYGTLLRLCLHFLAWPYETLCGLFAPVPQSCHGFLPCCAVDASVRFHP